MAEYIEREAAMDIVHQTYGNYSAAFPKLRELPAADVATVRHGRWERDEWGSYLRICSVCKKSPVYQDERGNSVAVYAGVCINCGAKMDLEHSK